MSLSSFHRITNNWSTVDHNIEYDFEHLETKIQIPSVLVYTKLTSFLKEKIGENNYILEGCKDSWLNWITLGRGHEQRCSSCSCD